MTHLPPTATWPDRPRLQTAFEAFRSMISLFALVRERSTNGEFIGALSPFLS
jgi:hypothetical protein